MLVRSKAALPQALLSRYSHPQEPLIRLCRSWVRCAPLLARSVPYVAYLDPDRLGTISLSFTYTFL
jgi:hypothetical protein